MKISKFLVSFILLVAVCSCAPRPKPYAGLKREAKWRALHLLDYTTDGDLETLGKNIPELADMGVNVIVFEVDYHFDFKSHPELRQGSNPITKEGARKFAETCRRSGIRLIPEFQCLGHQSWKSETFPLLTVYPQFDLTPGAFPENKDIYCREWDPLNREVNRIVFELIDEIIAAFEADALHVGMDEVFLLGSEHSPTTRGKNPAELFARAVNDIYDHLVKKRHVEMLMWGDRLIDGEKYDFGEWESSTNGTAAAIDLIPKDIIICPWHYEIRDTYPSIPLFLEKGFRVLPSGWKSPEATEALIRFGEAHADRRLLGHLFTTWGVKKENLLEFPPLVEGLNLLKNEPPGS